MTNAHLISGSMMGSATDVADEIETVLKDNGYSINRHDSADPEQLKNENLEVLVVCTSTTGNGDLPDELHDFYRWITCDFPRLNEMRYLVVALGDSNFEKFCGGGELINTGLQELGATEIAPMLRIDASEEFEPEEVASKWVLQQFQNAG